MTPASGGAPGSNDIPPKLVTIEILSHPFDGLFETILERGPRFPTNQLRGKAIVGAKSIDLALCGTYPSRILNHDHIFTRNLHYQVNHATDGYLASRTNIDDASESCVGLGTSKEAVDSISYKVEVSQRRHASQFDLTSGEGLGNGHRNHGSRGLSGPESI